MTDNDSKADSSAKPSARRTASKKAPAKKKKKTTKKKATARKSPAVQVKGPSRRAVIVAGVRTPFVRAFGSMLRMDTIDLGVAATGALLDKTQIDCDEVEGIVWGGVVIPGLAPNIAREIALDLKMPSHVEGMTVTRACASGLQAVTLAAAAIERGDADVMIAGGSDSTSNGELKLPQKVVQTLGPLAFGKGAGPMDYVAALAQLMPLSSVLPTMPKIAERTTGQVMGEAAEEMAQRNKVSREAQDRFAEQSHHRAAAAVSGGRFADEVAPLQTPEGKWIHQDEIIRGDTSFEKLSKLRPVFAKGGSVTAGNSSALTDGAAAVLLMSEEKALALGYKPLAAFRSWAYSAVDPADQLLLGPALAMPKALQRAGMSLADADLVDMHEAFAAQVLSVVHALGSKAFATERLGRSEAVGEIPSDSTYMVDRSL